MNKFLLNRFSYYFDKAILPYWCVLLLDCTLCFLSGIFVCWLFYRGAQTLGNILPISRTLAIYMVFNLIAFRVFHIYTGVIRYTSFIDLKRVAYAMALAFAMVWVFHLYVLANKEHLYPVIVPLHFRQILSMYVLSTLVLWGVRVIVKSIYEVTILDGTAPSTLIYGVKDGAVGLAKNIRNTRPIRFHLKGFISPAGEFVNKTLMGETVYPIDEHLPEILRSLNVQAVLVSPLRNNEFRNDQDLQNILAEARIKTYMAMEAKEWENGNEFDASQLKEVSVEDLLPRDEIDVDMEKVAAQIAGRRILVTGSAGSIGYELVRQIASCKPSNLLLVDQAETPQHDVSLMMQQEWPDIVTEVVVASIANEKRMESLFREFRPEYVFHAAAYKHVPMMESNPSESIQNNVYGTQVIADLSVKYGVLKFVMISTDKAVNPTNVMGCSKRICEIYVQSLDKAIKDGKVAGVTQFVTTRFGNVLGSNGSVIPLFEKQIKAGGPVTVTDPNIIRFFMLIPEACKLVLEAGVHGNGGEIFIFDMGKPVKIADLAKRMILLSGAENVEIKYTGLRPGEKLYEEVLANAEDTLPSFHQKIRIAQVREYDYEQVLADVKELREVAFTYDNMQIVAKMKAMVPEFVSTNEQYAQITK